MTTPTAASAAANEPRAASAFWYTLWLALALAACKCSHVAPPINWTLPELQRVGADAIIHFHADVLYALVVGLLAQLCLWTIGRSRGGRRLVWTIFAVVAFVSIGYAVFSVKFFNYQRRPLTRSLLYMAGDAKNMRSSVASFVTTPALAAMLGLPFLCLIPTWFSTSRWPRFIRWTARGLALVGLAAVGLCAIGLVRFIGLSSTLHHLQSACSSFLDSVRGIGDGAQSDFQHALSVAALCIAAGAGIWCILAGGFSTLRGFGRICTLLLIGAALAMAAVAQGEVNGVWGSGHDGRRVADNPHVAFISSYLFGPVPIRIGSFAPADQADFQTVAERGDGAPTPDLKRGPKNVILIIGESLGAQHMGIYGGKWDTTPRLKIESSHALIFDNYYSHLTNTANSLVSLVLGVYSNPSTYREWTVEWPKMPGTAAPQVLGQRGYRTAFIAAGDNNYSNQAAFLANRGFDTIWDYRNSGHEDLSNFSWGVEDRYMVDMILKWIDQGRDRPFCIYAWNQGTHHPFYAGPGHQEIQFVRNGDPHGNMSWDLNNYLNAMHEFDRQMGRLFDALRQRQLADDTIVIITGDHGEAFGLPRKTIGHSGKVYQQDIHVPLMLWNPALFTSAQRLPTIGAHVDLSPTILDLLNAPLPATWQGRSLFDPKRPPRAYFYGAMDDGIFGVRENNWKYIFNADFGREELYDLAADGDEDHNAARAHQDLCVRLKARLAAWKDRQDKMYNGN